MLSLKIKKSAGVKVTFPVFLCIKAGNDFRNSRHWDKAARSYEKALRKDPGLTHIWIQLGHMGRELHDDRMAANAYAQAFLCDPTHPDASMRAMSYMGAADQALQAKAKSILLHEKYPELTNLLNEDAQTPKSVVFDITDLIMHFAHKRSLTGIQRIQAEIIYALVKERPDTIGIATFLPGSKSWRTVPVSFFIRLILMVERSSDVSDPAWIREIELLNGLLFLSSELRFPTGAHLVSLGANWSIEHYIESLETTKKEAGLRYTVFIHDLIPIKFPELCPDGLVRDYGRWIRRIIPLTDYFIANSQSTRNDLVTFSRDIAGRDLSDNVLVTPLDARLGLKGNKPVPLPSTLPERFVLLVSTIEPRKGHLFVAKVWKALIEAHGEAAPALVCIGQTGWKSEGFHAFLKDNPDVAKRIHLLNQISDDILMACYQHCLFTIYPSTYEGWGLPITESLCFGKVPVVSRNSALTEAGGRFASYFETNDLASCLDAVTALSFDDTARKALEANIAQAFSPREWSDLAEQIKVFLDSREAPQSVM